MLLAQVFSSDCFSGMYGQETISVLLGTRICLAKRKKEGE